MDYNSKDVLKYLNKHSSPEKNISFDELHQQLNMHEEYLEEALQNLLNQDLIKRSYKYHQVSGYPGSEINYRSTSKGKTFFKQQICEWFISVQNGIIFPIIVSLVINCLSLLFFH